jgi:hypothetical protein
MLCQIVSNASLDACGRELGFVISRRPAAPMPYQVLEIEADDIPHLIGEVGIVGVKVLVRCGLSPFAFQMRCTVVWLTFISLAIVRTLQCVPLAGLSYAVLVMILSMISALIGFLPAPFPVPLYH